MQTLAPVTSTQEVSGKLTKQEPVSYTYQRRLQVAFLLYMWDGARGGSKIEGVSRD